MHNNRAAFIYLCSIFIFSVFLFLFLFIYFLFLNLYSIPYFYAHLKYGYIKIIGRSVCECVCL